MLEALFRRVEDKRDDVVALTQDLVVFVHRLMDALSASYSGLMEHEEKIKAGTKGGAL